MADPATACLATLEELGGFFALVPAPGPGTSAVPWPEVLSEDALSTRFASVRAALAESSRLPVEQVDPKVAVSATQVGIASRLWSVALGGSVLHGWVPDLTSDNLVASPEHRGEVPLGVRDPEKGYAVPTLPSPGPDRPDRPGDGQRPHTRPDHPDHLGHLDLPGSAQLLAARVAHGPLAELEAACARVGRTPRRVLASNSTSALVGGARVLARLRPAQAATTWALTRELLTQPGVATGGAAVASADLPEGVGGAMERADEAFLRSGCCVFYRLPGHGLCPDCVLAPSRASEVTPGH